MTCAVIGDSIASGVSAALPQCASFATVGISAAGFDAHFQRIDGDLTAISLGSNQGPDDEHHMRAIRSRISGLVVWLLPPARARDTVAQIAAEYGDRVVDVRPWGTPERIHPSMHGYLRLAESVGPWSKSGPNAPENPQ